MRTVSRYPVAAVAIVVLIGLLVVTLAWPGALTAAAQEIHHVVQRLIPGEHTEVIQTDSQGAPEDDTPVTQPIIRDIPGGWSIKTSIGNFGGNLPPGDDATVIRFESVAELTENVPFAPRQPMALPEGYSFREALLVPAGDLFLFYAGPDGDIVLKETPLGETSVTTGRTVDGVTEAVTVSKEVSANSVMMVTDKSIESVSMQGVDAAWIEGSGLLWEADGFSFQLGGAHLSQEETLEIAESIH